MDKMLLAEQYVEAMKSALEKLGRIVSETANVHAWIAEADGRGNGKWKRNIYFLKRLRKEYARQLGMSRAFLEPDELLDEVLKKYGMTDDSAPNGWLIENAIHDAGRTHEQVLGFFAGAIERYTNLCGFQKTYTWDEATELVRGNLEKKMFRIDTLETVEVHMKWAGDDIFIIGDYDVSTDTVNWGNRRDGGEKDADYSATDWRIIPETFVKE